MLQWIQCLSSFSDQDAHVFSGQNDINNLFFFIVGNCDINFHIHLVENIL